MTKPNTRTGRGRSTSPAKGAAARANGAKGGRPTALESHEARLARALALAYVATQGLITYQTAERNYGHQAPGPYWIALANRVLDDLIRHAPAQGIVDAP